MVDRNGTESCLKRFPEVHRNSGRQLGSSQFCVLLVDWHHLLSHGRCLYAEKSGAVGFKRKRVMGQLCYSLAGLGQLVFLNLSGNQINGVLPPKIFQMQCLEEFDLSINQFSGHNPQNATMPAVRVLNVSANKLVGSVATMICDSSTNLKSLNMVRNAFHGQFPFSFTNCSDLHYLSLKENNLSGKLTESLFRLQHLRYLLLQGDIFSGTLSRGIGNLSNLVEIDISSNSFFGEIPDVFLGILDLQRFSANANNFSGYLPYSLVNSLSLEMLNLDKNSLEVPLLPSSTFFPTYFKAKCLRTCCPVASSLF